MSLNVGGIDRAVRILLGVVWLLLAFLHVITARAAVVAYVVAAIALVTGLFRFCPAWAIFGINTCPVKGSK